MAPGHSRILITKDKLPMRLNSSLCALLVVSVIATQPARAGFFGPDDEPLNPPQISQRLQREPTVFSASGKALEIRTKGAAIGGFLVGMILSSAMASAGGGGAANAAQMQRQMQANMEIAQQANVHIQGAVKQLSAEAAGAAAADLAQRGPLPLLAQRLGDALRAQQARLVAADSEPKPGLFLSLRQSEWKLDFETFSSDYVLRSALLLELHDKPAGKIHLRQACSYQYPEKMPLEDWEQDEHLAIAKAAEEIAQRCHKEFSAALNLAQAAAVAGTPTPADAPPPAKTDGEAAAPDQTPMTQQAH